MGYYFVIGALGAVYAWFSPVVRYNADGSGRTKGFSRFVSYSTFLFWPLTLPILIYLHVLDARRDSV